MRFSTALILVPAVVIAAIVAVANRDEVRLSLDPFSDAHPALVLHMPLYVLVFGVLLIGVLLGGLAVTLRRAARSRPMRPSESIERAIVPLDTVQARNDSSEV